jgi:hypothetical protein
MKSSLTVRYVGEENYSRRYLLQRQDGKYWSGHRWVSAISEARLFHQLADATRAYRTIQNRKFKGKQKRKFTIQLDLTVHGEARFSQDDLRRFLASALHLNLDNAAAGDGPNGTFVVAVALLHSLDEVDVPVKSGR